MAHDEAAGRREQVGGRHTLGRELVDDPVVEADEGEVGLPDGQVLVVARIGDQRVLVGTRVRGRSKPGLSFSEKPSFGPDALVVPVSRWTLSAA